MKTIDKATERPWHHVGNSIRDDKGRAVAIMKWVDDNNTVPANASLIVQAVNEWELLNAIAEAATEYCVNKESVRCQIQIMDALFALTTHRKAARE